MAKSYAMFLVRVTDDLLADVCSTEFEQDSHQLSPLVVAQGRNGAFSHLQRCCPRFLKELGALGSQLHGQSAFVLEIRRCFNQSLLAQPIHHSLDCGSVHRGNTPQVVLRKRAQFGKLRKSCKLGRGQFGKRVREQCKMTLGYAAKHETDLVIKNVGFVCVAHSKVDNPPDEFAQDELVI